jgi:predicted membrane-bound spermidine synthase
MWRTTMILTVSILEGGILLGFEVLSSKLMAPFLGTTIQVWAAILSVTLLGLALGYRYGGKLVKQNNTGRLVNHLLIAGILIATSSFTSRLLLPSTLSFPAETAAILASILVLFPVVFLLGTVSPLLVELLNTDKHNTARGASLIYGAGTFSGILFVLLSVFVFMPAFGLMVTFLILGVLLIIAALISRKILAL